MTPPSSHDTDRLFAEFFGRQLPDPWPACDALAGPKAETRALYADNADGLPRSRATLAASVAALLGLGLYVSSGPRPAPTAGKPAAPEAAGGMLDKATADGGELLKAGQPMMP